MLDLSEPPILVVDQQGVVFESQCSSSTTAHARVVCIQESRNVNAKLKAVLEEEEEEGYQGYEDSDASASDNEGQIGRDPYYMCDAEDLEMEEGKIQRDEEVEEEETDDEQSERKKCCIMRVTLKLRNYLSWRKITHWFQKNKKQ